MRENHLLTDSIPNAVFVMDSLTNIGPLERDVPTHMTVYGKLTIRGVTRPIVAPLFVVFSKDKEVGMTVESEFTVKLSDYGVPRPEFLFLKLAEQIDIFVNLKLVLGPL
jgi:polyisoprenoid-binding protein YceI